MRCAAVLLCVLCLSGVVFLFITQPVFVVRDRVLFPGGLLRLSVGKPKSVRLVESLLAQRDDRHHVSSSAGPTILLAVFTQRFVLSCRGRVKDDVAVGRYDSLFDLNPARGISLCGVR